MFVLLRSHKYSGGGTEQNSGSEFYSHMRGGKERETEDATESEDNYLDEEIKEIQHSIHC